MSAPIELAFGLALFGIGVWALARAAYDYASDRKAGTTDPLSNYRTAYRWRCAPPSRHLPTKEGAHGSRCTIWDADHILAICPETAAWSPTVRMGRAALAYSSVEVEVST